MIKLTGNRKLKKLICILCAGVLAAGSCLYEPVYASMIASEDILEDEVSSEGVFTFDDDLEILSDSGSDDFDRITESVTDEADADEAPNADGEDISVITETDGEDLSGTPEAYENEAPLYEGDEEDISDPEMSDAEDGSGMEDDEPYKDGVIEQNGAAFMNSGRAGVAKMSMYEIASLYKSAGSYSKLFVREPVISGSGYTTGMLSNEAYIYAGKYINYFRHVAGLNNIGFAGSANESAAWGALVLAMNNKLTHTPDKPSGMSNDDYKKGSDATGSSNISYAGGYSETSIIRVAINGQIADSSASNMSTLGHRRWLLRPGVQMIGIGSANNGRAYYTDIKVFGDYVSYAKVSDYDFISWPSSGNNLSDTFGTEVPWSITLNPDRYKAPDKSKVKVTLESVATGKKWVFSKSTSSQAASGTDYFTINNQGYGVANCIIFRPGSVGQDVYSGEYIVAVTGLKDKSGKDATIAYKAAFDTYENAINHRATEVTDNNSGILPIVVESSISGQDNIFINGKTVTFKVLKGKGKTTWSSSDPSIVTVTSKGKVKAVAKGSAVITAVNNGNVLTKTVRTFNVPKFLQGTYLTNLGQSIMVVPVIDSDLTGLVLSVSNKKIAGVDSRGIVTPLKKGTVTVKAKVNGYIFKTKVKIYDPTISGKNKVRVGKSMTLKIKNGHGSTAWTVSDENIATVTSKGKVKGITKGTVTVTAVNNGKRITKEITVY